MAETPAEESFLGPAILKLQSVTLVLDDDGFPAGMPWDQGVATIGDQCVDWAEEMLAQPDGRNAGTPWRFSQWQARFLMWWYAVDDEGEWLFTGGQLVLPKGAGKSPLAAVVACIELMGPCTFSHFAADGEAMGIPHPSPQFLLAAVAEKQTKNTMRLVASMLRNGKIFASMGHLMDIGLKVIRTPNGELSITASNAAAIEGGQTTGAILDEPHRWLKSNGGTEMYETIQGNLTKTTGRGLQTTNAWIPGRDSVAEKMGQQAEDQRSGKMREAQVLQYMRVAPPDTKLTDMASLQAALEYVYEGCPWINVKSIMRTFRLGTYPVWRARAMFLNQIVASDSALIDPLDWDQQKSPKRLEPGDEIVLGFDGGRSDDATALIACRVSDRYFQPIGIWERPEGLDPEDRWEISRPLVDGYVRNTFAKYKVLAFFADVEHWETYVDSWSQDFRKELVIKASPESYTAWDMRGRLKEGTMATEKLQAAIEDHVILHNGDSVLRRHVLNAEIKLNQFGRSFMKRGGRESKHKVDGFAAMLLADMARTKLIESGKIKKRGMWAL